MQTYTVQGIDNILEVKLLSYRGDNVILNVHPEVFNNAIRRFTCSGSGCPYNPKEDSCRPITAYGLDRNKDRASLDNIQASTQKLSNDGTTFYVGTSNNGDYQRDWAYYLATANNNDGRNGFKNQLDELITGRNPFKYLLSKGFVDAPNDLKYFVVTGGAYKSSSACYYAGYMRVFFKYFSYEEFYKYNCLLDNEQYQSNICQAIISKSGGEYYDLVNNYCLGNNQDDKNKFYHNSTLIQNNTPFCIYSLNSKYKACRQPDGNFIIYTNNKNPVELYKAPYMSIANKSYSIMHNNKKFIIYDTNGNILWTNNAISNDTDPEDKIFNNICKDAQTKNNNKYYENIKNAQIKFCTNTSNLLQNINCESFWRMGDNELNNDHRTSLDNTAKQICKYVGLMNNPSNKLLNFCSCINPPDNIKNIQSTLYIDPKCSYKICKDNGYRLKGYDNIPCPACVQNMDLKGINMNTDNIKQYCNVDTSTVNTPSIGTVNNSLNSSNNKYIEPPSISSDNNKSYDETNNMLNIYIGMGFILILILIIIIAILIKKNNTNKNIYLNSSNDFN